MAFGSSGGRKLVDAFDDGAITSNGGAVLLAAADRRIGLSSRLPSCFRDLRDGARIRHTIADLLRQRLYGLALGHEDLIDHDARRHDPALTAGVVEDLAARRYATGARDLADIMLAAQRGLRRS